MDLWAVHLKNGTNCGNPAAGALLLNRNSIPERPNSWNIGKFGGFEIRPSRRLLSSSSHPSFTVKAMAKKNNHDDSSSSSSSSGNGDQSIPDRDSSRRNNSSDSNESDDSASQKSHHANTDWREFRAMLYNNYQVETAESDAHKQGGAPHVSKPLGSKWAHPLSVPETGCVLVATEKLDGVRTFERTVVLLLRSGTRHPQEGPFGVVINRPLHKKIKHMKSTNNELTTTFSDCSLHFGGPLDASMFLLKVGKKSKFPGFEEVIPGLCFGARNSLDEAAELVKRGVLKSQDFKFFVGYAGWQLDQLREEIESDYWYVAACSPNLIFGDSSDSWSESLWKEILQEMGGHYSELSRKPKQDI
ncbi:Electron transporter, putative [Theobroma cacao]|uniref:Electron transporter, putative n=1 Tax=Theobroma cacao TaxID=3641 RepID=A0A061FI87_THECC|nr:Electron transporter, putative [Theobroma cacao]